MTTNDLEIRACARCESDLEELKALQRDYLGINDMHKEKITVEQFENQSRMAEELTKLREENAELKKWIGVQRMKFKENK